MIKALTLVGVLLAGLPAGAQAVSERGMALMKLIAANNCAISGPTDDVFIAGGFSEPSEMFRLLGELEALGVAQIDLDAVTLNADICKQVRAEALVNLIAVNGCSIHESEMDAVFLAGGFGPDEAKGLLQELVAQGFLQTEGERLGMDGAMCAQLVQAVADTSPEGLSEDRIAAFVAVFQTHECVLATKGEGAIPEDELMALFAEAGFVGGDVPTYASALIESGRARVDVATDAVTILPPLCGKAME